MKKKMLSLALALVMCLDLTVPAFASEYGPLEVRFEKNSSSEVVVLVMDKATLSGDKITVIPETTLSMKIENKDTEDWSYRSISLLPDYLHESGEWWVVPNLYEALTDFNSTRNAGELFNTADRYVGYSGAVSSATRYQVGVGDCDKEYYLHIDRSAQGQPTTPAFTDVPAGAYYADAVKWAVENKITSGTSATTFSPDATCNRAQILSFLWRANGSPEPTAANPFTDVKDSDYFYKAALWAAEKGLVSGSIFGANTDCTRAMTVEYLWKAAGSPAPASKASFTDVSANADYAQAVTWAVENEITSGTGGGNFSPDTICTRGQIMTFLYRAMGK